MITCVSDLQKCTGGAGAGRGSSSAGGAAGAAVMGGMQQQQRQWLLSSSWHLATSTNSTGARDIWEYGYLADTF